MKIIRIGRAEDNDYVVNHPAVSGHHADVYVYDNGAIQYMDHSTNGTMINSILVHNSTCALIGTEYIGLPGGINIPVSDILAKDVSSDTSKPDDEEKYYKTVYHEEEKSGGAGYDIRRGMDFGETLSYFFNHYTDFNGRARRQEYWYMYLWNLIFGIIPFVNIIWALATFIPNLGLSVRRLHDVGRSGFWLFLGLIPLVGAIILFVWSVTDSDQGPNEYGPSPKYR